MSTLLADLCYIAEVEFGDLIIGNQPLGEKLRLFLTDGSTIDLWLSRKLPDRFGFHWERRHINNTFYRYDNFPNTAWRGVATYPRHFHNGSQNAVEAAPFADDLETGFREFMSFVRANVNPTRQT